MDSAMIWWAIVPVKPLQRGKSRLSSVLSEGERTDLNSRLLAHTIQTLKSVPEIEQVLVVSRDPKTLALGGELGALTVRENGTPHLNTALGRATTLAKKSLAGGVLVVPADLPLLTPEAIEVVLDKGTYPPVVVIAPDRHHLGTNILLICPVGLIKYEFGHDSYQRHCLQARRKGVRLEICDLPTLALDIDLPEDLELAGLGQWETKT
jgi:2-phospho-L-lactate guanylyltransferase